MAQIQHLQKCHSSTLSKPRALPVPPSFHHFEKGGFLNSSGEDTGYFYTAVRDRLSIFKSCGTVESGTLLHEFSFGSSAVVVDCVYFALNGNFLDSIYHFACESCLLFRKLSRNCDPYK